MVLKTIANTVTEVKIIGNGSGHQHTNTSIIAATGRTGALKLTIEDLNISASSNKPV